MCVTILELIEYIGKGLIFIGTCLISLNQTENDKDYYYYETGLWYEYFI